MAFKWQHFQINDIVFHYAYGWISTKSTNQLKNKYKKKASKCGSIHSDYEWIPAIQWTIPKEKSEWQTEDNDKHQPF